MHTPGTPARMSRGNCSSPQALTSPTPSSSPPPPPPPPPPSLFCSILSLHLRTSELEQYRPRCPHASNLKIELTHLISYVLRISFTFFFFTGSISIHGHLKLRIDIFICEHKYLIYAIVEKLWQNYWFRLQRSQMCPNRITLRWRPPPPLPPPPPPQAVITVRLVPTAWCDHHCTKYTFNLSLSVLFKQFLYVQLPANKDHPFHQPSKGEATYWKS